MSAVKKIAAKGTVASRDEARPLTVNAGDTIVVRRGGRQRSLIIRCPCGCGDDLVVNLDGRTGPAWRLYTRSGKLSLYPSYWRDSGCESHFIIWRNRILWCGRYDEEKEDSNDPALQTKIFGRINSRDFTDYRALAIELDAIPWDILWCCREMVRGGSLEERSGEDRGWFRRKSGT
jgi:hypothetical protein